MLIKNQHFSKFWIFFFVGIVTISCEDEFKKYSVVNYEPCLESEVVLNQFVITDFECQSNMDLPNVSVVRNPAEIQINKSKFVGEYVLGAGEIDNLSIDYNGSIDLSTHSLFKIKVRTEVQGSLLVRLEGGTSEPAEITKELLKLSGDINSWVEYEFNFHEQVEENHTKLVLLFNASTESNENKRYYIDDLYWDETDDPCSLVDEDLSIISDFECNQNYFLGDPTDKTSAPIVANPDVRGLNLSDFVGKYIDDGFNAWDSIYIDFNGEIDLSLNSQLSIKIHSSRTAPILAKLEGGTPVEDWGVIERTDEWVEYVFDFSNAKGLGNSRLVLFFNGGQSDGTTTDVYYIDDIKFLPDYCSAILDNCDSVDTPDFNIISDFDCQQNYHLGVDPDIDDVIVVENPNVSCENRSLNVGRYIDNGTDAWDNLQVIYDAPIDLTLYNQLKFKIYSSKSIQVLAKLEGGIQYEIWSPYSLVSEWEEFSFDFSDAVGNGNTKLVLFFNAAKSDGTSEDVYYLDDIRFDLK